MKKMLALLGIVVLSGLMVGSSAWAATGKTAVSKAVAKIGAISKESKDCIACHKEMNPGVYSPWAESNHAKKGVSCYECHKADKSRKDAQEHNGYTIAVIVSPKDCGRCHAKESKEMTESHHAKAHQFTGSLDNFLGRIVTGEQNFNLGCAQCHGSTVEVLPGGKLKAGTWPNTGIGRINPDGSMGNCTACHYRHSFAVEVSRNPKNCGKCHQGPDHPQIEIYELSKHGIDFDTNREEIMAKAKTKNFVLGKDYNKGPVCSTCHMGATRQLPSTHDVGARIKWTLRPPISKVLENGDKKRADMNKVCSECHQQPWLDGFFKQFDDYVKLYNDKFAIPATSIMKFLAENKATDPTPLNEIVEIHYWHLWHHEGRRGRHGAAMNAPDYSHWHGMYEVAINFYFMLLPAADEAVAAKKDPALSAKWEAFRAKIMDTPEHKWKKGMSKDEVAQVIEFYQKRYGKEGGQ